MDLNRVIEITFQHLAEASLKKNNPKGCDIASSLGEVETDGVVYQMQICLVADKKMWVDKDEVRYQEIVKIHK